MLQPLGTGRLNSNEKILSLDGLRGIAILFVLAFHFVSWADESAPTYLSKFTGVGNTGVDLFFVLSGFLITGILSDAKGSKGYFRNFYMRRMLRIFPLYYAIVAIATLIGPTVAPHNGKLAEVAAQQGWLWLYAVNIAVAVKNSWTFYGMNHFWSLAVEEQFYLMWPFLVLALTRTRMMQLCIVLTVLALVCRLCLEAKGLWLAAYALTPSRMDELASGGFAALLLRSPTVSQTLPRRAALVSWIGGFAAIVLLSPMANQFSSASAFLPTAFTALFGSLIVLLVRGNAGIARYVLERRWLRIFGRYSYGLYVLHHPLRQVFERLFPPAPLALHLGSPAAGALAFAVLSSIVSLALAFASFHVFETPWLRLKRYFEYGRPVSARGVVPRP